MFAPPPLCESTCSSTELNDGSTLVSINVIVNGDLDVRAYQKVLISGTAKALELLLKKEFEEHLIDGSVVN